MSDKYTLGRALYDEKIASTVYSININLDTLYAYIHNLNDFKDTINLKLLEEQIKEKLDELRLEIDALIKTGEDR